MELIENRALIRGITVHIARGKNNYPPSHKGYGKNYSKEKPKSAVPIVLQVTHVSSNCTTSQLWAIKRVWENEADYLRHHQASKGKKT